MRIVIYGINHFPELTGIGKYTGELVDWLSERGHDVVVVSAPPYYPEWKVHENYSGSAYKRERIHGATVFRCPLWVPKNPSGLSRMVHLASFAITSSPIVVFLSCFWRPAIVFTVEPTFFCAPTAILSAKLAGAKAVLHIQDFEIDAAFALGILKSARLRRLARLLESFIMRRFERVSTISRAMKDLALRKGVDASRAIIFPNWVDISQIEPAPSLGKNFRQAIGIDENAFVCLYSGNMGEKQGLEIIIDAAHMIKEDILFIMCGDGKAKKNLVERARGLTNVMFIPLQPLENLNALLNSADLHLLPQRADAADLVLPSKLTGILASGKPVVAIAREETMLAEIVESAGGRVCTTFDSSEFAKAILELKATPNARNEAGVKARAYAERHLSKSAILEKFEDELSKIADCASEGQPMDIISK